MSEERVCFGLVCLACIFTIFIFQTPLQARSELSGYAKSLNFVSPDSDGTGRVRGLSGNRLRLDGRLEDASARFNFRLISDSEILFGTLLKEQKPALNNSVSRNEILDLNWDLNEKDNVLWRQALYRAWGEARFRDLNLAIGRQRIAWGQGRLWNPTDVVNPYNPLSVERQERPGSDLAHVRWNFSALSFLEGVYVPKRGAEWNNSLLLGRARVNFHEMDFGFLGGKRGEERLLGADFAAQIFEGSFRSEASHSFGSALRKDFARAVASFDRSFNVPNTLYVLGEYFYNGIGESRLENYGRVVLNPTDQKFLGKDYFGFGVAYDLTAIWKLETYGIVNLNDSSAFLGPKVSWQAFADFEAAAGYQVFTGRSRSEFGSLQDIGFLQVQWFFSGWK